MRLSVPLNACLIIRTYQKTLAVPGPVRCTNCNACARHRSNSRRTRPLNSCLPKNLLLVSVFLTLRCLRHEVSSHDESHSDRNSLFVVRNQVFRQHRNHEERPKFFQFWLHSEWAIALPHCSTQHSMVSPQQMATLVRSQTQLVW